LILLLGENTNELYGLHVYKADIPDVFRSLR
jgi:hypothetical protein